VGALGTSLTGPERYVYYFMLGLGALRQCVLLLQEVAAWWAEQHANRRRRRRPPR